MSETNARRDLSTSLRFARDKVRLISRLRYASLEMRVGVVSMLRFALGKGAVRSIDCRLNKSTFILTEVEKSAYVSTIYNIILGLIEKFYKKTQEKNL